VWHFFLIVPLFQSIHIFLKKKITYIYLIRNRPRRFKEKIDQSHIMLGYMGPFNPVLPI